MRLLMKTLSYGMMHVVVAISIAYILTNDIYIALGLGLIEPMVQSFCFFFHEKIWERNNYLSQPVNINN